MKKVLIVTIALLLFASVATFAQTTNNNNQILPGLASYNKPGQINFTASVGYLGYLEVNAGLEMIFGEFNIAGFPISWGIAARGIVGLYGSYIEWGVGGLFMVHLGISGLPLDFYEGIGVGFSGWTAVGYGDGGFSGSDIAGVVWYLSPNLGLVLEGCWIGYAYSYGVGLTLKF